MPLRILCPNGHAKPRFFFPVEGVRSVRAANMVYSNESKSEVIRNAFLSIAFSSRVKDFPLRLDPPLRYYFFTVRATVRHNGQNNCTVEQTVKRELDKMPAKLDGSNGTRLLQRMPCHRRRKTSSAQIKELFNKNRY
jgi:hypothetical protein